MILSDVNLVYTDVLLTRGHGMTAIWRFFAENDQSSVQTAGGGTKASNYNTGIQDVQDNTRNVLRHLNSNV